VRGGAVLALTGRFDLDEHFRSRDRARDLGLSSSAALLNTREATLRWDDRRQDRLLTVVTSEEAGASLPSDPQGKIVNLYDLDESLRETVLINSVTRMLCEMLDPERVVPVPMSHTSQDQDLSLIESVRASFDSPQIAGFFRPSPLSDDHWQQDIASWAEDGLLLAFRTDAYIAENRDHEIAAAMDEGMPVVVIDALEQLEASAPHGAPSRRWQREAPARSQARVLGLMLREVLRSRYFPRRVEALCHRCRISLPNHVLLTAPDLHSAHQARKKLRSKEGLVIYPDPPLESWTLIELERSFRELTFVTPLTLPDL